MKIMIIMSIDIDDVMTWQSFLRTGPLWGNLTSMVSPPLNSSPPSATYMRRWTESSLIQIMACCLDGTKPLSEPMLTYCQSDPKEHISMKFYLKLKYFHSRKCIWACHLRNGGHFVSASMCSGACNAELRCLLFVSLVNSPQKGSVM